MNGHPIANCVYTHFHLLKSASPKQAADVCVCVFLLLCSRFALTHRLTKALLQAEKNK